MLKQTITLNDAQIKAQNSGDFGLFEVVPAPGSGKVLIFSQAVVLVDTTGGAYTNIGANVNIKIAYDVQGSALDISKLGTSGATSLLNGITGPRMITFLPIASSFTEAFQFGLSTDYENKNLGLGLSNLPGLADFTGGNVANTMKVTIYYDILTL